MTTTEDYLQKFHTTHGEEAWRDEVRRLAVAALRTGSAEHEQYWRKLTLGYPWLDWAELKQQALMEPLQAGQLIQQVLKDQMPGIKSQAQYDAAIGALNAARLLVNALLEVKPTVEARRALELALDAVSKATELTLKLEDLPEAADSVAAQQFKQEPAQFREAEIQAQLLNELAKLNSVAVLNNWYKATKDLRDKLVTQKLRNELLDAVRARRNALVGW